MHSKRLCLQLLCVLGLNMTLSSGCQAEIISIINNNPGHNQAGPATNALVNFTDWNLSGCGGVSPCIVPASIIPVQTFEWGWQGTLTYGPNFDFNYPSTGPGDRLIFQIDSSAQATAIDVTIEGGTLYTTPAPQRIPDAGLVTGCPGLNPNPGHYCYTIDPALTAVFGVWADGGGLSTSPWPPYMYTGFGKHIDLYFAVADLNPDGGALALDVFTADTPEPSSLWLLATGLTGLAEMMRRRLRAARLF